MCFAHLRSAQLGPAAVVLLAHAALGALNGLKVAIDLGPIAAIDLGSTVAIIDLGSIGDLGAVDLPGRNRWR